VVEAEAAVVLADVEVEAAEVGAPGAAPPTGEVGLVGASEHAAVTAAARPSQARAIFWFISVTGCPAGRAVL
jgi:hypothetical protein